MHPARFITFEGIDGCGKTTQLHMLAGRLRATGRTVKETIEPGGTEAGRAIRAILLDPAQGRLQPRAEMLLYFASRAQNVAEVIEPALAGGQIVLCDRFTDSTLVYQGEGRGIDPREIHMIDDIACRGLKPDLTILLDIDLETSLERARVRNRRDNNTETRIDDHAPAFFNRVREGYAALALQHPERICVIEARASVDAVAERVWQAVSGRI